MIVTASSGIPNWSSEILNNRGNSSPMVIFLPPTSVVTQLASPGFVHCDPVNEFVQTQEQISPLETLTPPLWHGLVFSQVVDAAAAAALFSLGTATRKTGRRMTMAMSMMMATMTAMKTLGRRPQQRRCFRPSSRDRESCERMLCSADRFLNRTGHDDRPSGVPDLGGGNDARISDNEPELRRRCANGSLGGLGSSRMSFRLAVRPWSSRVASCVARLIRSGRLVKLPRASASRTALKSKRGGLGFSATLGFGSAIGLGCDGSVGGIETSSGLDLKAGCWSWTSKKIGALWTPPCWDADETLEDESRNLVTLPACPPFVSLLETSGSGVTVRAVLIVGTCSSDAGFESPFGF